MSPGRRERQATAFQVRQGIEAGLEPCWGMPSSSAPAPEVHDSMSEGREAEKPMVGIAVNSMSQAGRTPAARAASPGIGQLALREV